MRSRFDEPAATHDEDSVGVCHAGKAVGDEDDRTAPDLLEVSVQNLSWTRIEQLEYQSCTNPGGTLDDIIFGQYCLQFRLI